MCETSPELRPDYPSEGSSSGTFLPDPTDSPCGECEDSPQPPHLACEQQLRDVENIVATDRARLCRLATRWLQRLGVQDPAAGGEDAYQQIVAEARSTLLHRAEPYPDWNPHGFVNKLLRRICLQWMTPGRSRVEPPGFPTHDRDQRMSDYLSAGIDETAQLALAESDTLFFVRCRVVANELGESGRLVVDRWGKPHPRAEKIHAIVLAILDRVEAGQMVDPALWHPAGGTSPFEQALSQILVATARDEDERRFWRDGKEQARRKKLSIRLLLDTQAVPSLIREMQSRGMWSGDGPGSLRAV